MQVTNQRLMPRIRHACRSVSRSRVGLFVAVGALALAPAAMALTIIGTPGDDQIVGSRAHDRINALAGNDKIRARGGPDHVVAGPGNDVVHGGAGRDFIRGREGDDQTFGDGGNDEVRNGLGVDVSRGGPGNDRVFGAAKRDVELEGVDSLAGGPGNDRIYARDGEADEISCGRGRHDVAQLDMVDVIVDATEERPNGSCEKVVRADPPPEPTPAP